MSWERAEAHTCADGYFCKGHKVNVVYEKQKDGYYKGETMRVPYCERCKQSCSTETITNQNFGTTNHTTQLQTIILAPQTITKTITT